MIVHAVLIRLIVPLFAALLLSASSAFAADTWKIDPVHSSVGFGIMHMGVAMFYGTFTDVAGEIVLDESDPAGSSVNAVVQAASVATRNDKRDEHLRSPDFFNVAVFPEITFRSTSVEPMEGDTATVHGELTMLGVTKPVTVEVRRTGMGENRDGVPVAGFEGSFMIKRSDFGMNFMQGGLGDDVQIMLSFETVKQTEAAAPAA